MQQACTIDNAVYSRGMKSKVLSGLMLIVLLVVVFGAAGCCSTNTGAREFIPGKGWTPVD